MGYFVPARGADEQELLALRRAVGQMETLLAEHGIGEDEIVREFRARRARA